MPSGRRQLVTMALRSEPSGLIEWILPPLNSRTNSFPTAPLWPDPPFDFVARASAILFSFQKPHGISQRLGGRCRFQGLGEVRRALLKKRRQCLLGVFRTNLRTELFVLGLHRRLD